MKATTLTDYIGKKLKTDPEFAKQYAREQAIHNMAGMLVFARKNAPLTQAELAQKMGTKQSVIARLESGQSNFVPSLETLIRIAQALNVKLTLSLHPFPGSAQPVAKKRAPSNDPHNKRKQA